MQPTITPSSFLRCIMVGLRTKDREGALPCHRPWIGREHPLAAACDVYGVVGVVDFMIVVSLTGDLAAAGEGGRLAFFARGFRFTLYLVE